jgi:tetratricopeptide (TPR) repeat protein
LLKNLLEALLGILPDWFARLLGLRRRRTPPFRTSDFIASGTKHHPPSDKPPLFTDFVSRRDAERRDLVKRVLDLWEGGAKVVLWGDGGLGKSTLAYQAAAAYARKRPVGLAWVSADGVPDFGPGHFVEALRGYLGCEASLVAVMEALRERPHVVVLDNADTLQGPGLLLALAQSFPTGSRLLVTSRQVDDRFRGLGDTVEVPPMRPEEALAFTRQEAVRLEVTLTGDQVKAIAVEAQGNAEVLRWLLGHAWHGSLDEALRDMPQLEGLAADREQGPGRAFGRTWDVLTLRERTALAILSLLPQATKEWLGTCAADAAIAKTLDGVFRWNVARHDGTGQTWSVTGLTRDLASRRIYEVLDAWQATLDPLPLGEGGGEGHQRQAAAVLASVAASGEVMEALDRRGDWRQFVTYGDRGLAAARVLGDDRLVAVAAHHLAMAHQAQGRSAEAEGLYRESLALEERLGNVAGIARTKHQLGMLAQAQGRHAEAEGLYRESLALKERLGDVAGIARTKHELGMLAQDQGRYPEAEGLYRESLALAERLGYVEGIAGTKHQLGMLAHDQGRYSEAEGLYRESLALQERLGNVAGIAGTKHQLGMLAQAQGRHAEAEGLYRESLALEERLGNVAGIASTKHALGVLAQQQGKYPEAEALYRESLASEERLGNLVGIASTKAQMGLLAEAHGNLPQAAALLQEALDLFRRIGSPYAAQAERALARVRQAARAGSAQP